MNWNVNTIIINFLAIFVFRRISIIFHKCSQYVANYSGYFIIFV